MLGVDFYTVIMPLCIIAFLALLVLLEMPIICLKYHPIINKVVTTVSFVLLLVVYLAFFATLYFLLGLS